MLIHKTMKMPTSCLSCWISPTCEVWVREKSKHKGYDNRLENCPLEPVKHGHWYLSPFDGNWTCSKCGDKPYHYDMKNMNYCPNCGAKMDEVEEDG